jgi:hypothetical protein
VLKKPKPRLAPSRGGGLPDRPESCCQHQGFANQAILVTNDAIDAKPTKMQIPLEFL